MKRLIYVIVALAALASCQKEVKHLHPLTLSSASVMMPAEGGRHVIVVYTDGEWTAEFSSHVDWAEIETVSGKGIGGIGFVCTKNTGIGRSVDVIVRQGKHTDVITMNQQSALSSISFEFEKSTVSISNAALNLSVGFSTNITDLDACTEWTVTDGLGKEPDWISDVYMKDDHLHFKVGGTGSERLAYFTVTAVDKADGSLSKVARMTLQQTAESPYLVPGDWVTSVAQPAEASVILIPVRTNFGYSLLQMLENATVSEQWAMVVPQESDENNIAVSFEANTTGVQRECTVTIPYRDLRGNAFPISFKLTQGE